MIDFVYKKIFSGCFFTQWGNSATTTIPTSQSLSDEYCLYPRTIAFRYLDD